jgi:hypothetical protein
MPSSLNDIGISIRFETNGQLVIERLDKSIAGLNARLVALNSTVGNPGRALRDFQTALGNTSDQLTAKFGNALQVTDSLVGAFVGTLKTLAGIGFAAVIAEIGTMVVAFEKLGSAFLQINEQFKNLEITLRSTFGSTKVAQDITGFIQDRAPRSLLDIQGQAEVARAISLIPFGRQQIASQAASGQINDQKGFLERSERLVERLVAYRPDQSVESAIFAIREALTGQFRSIERRFDIPPSAILGRGSDRTLKEIGSDPELAFNQLEGFFKSIISDQAIKEQQRQPDVLFRKIPEQLINIPLKEIGDAGLFQAITKKLSDIFDSIIDFVQKKLPTFAKKLSDSLSTILDRVTEGLSKSLDTILSLGGFGSKDLPGASLLERTFGAISSAIDSLSTKIPDVFGKLNEFLKNALPALSNLLSLFSKFTDFYTSALAKAPLLTIFGTALIPQLSGLVGTVARQATAGLGAEVTRLITTSQLRAFEQVNDRYRDLLTLPNLIRTTATGREQLAVNASTLNAVQAAALGVTSTLVSRPFLRTGTLATARTAQEGAAAAVAAETGAIGIGVGTRIAAVVTAFSTAVASFAIAAGIIYAASQLFEHISDKNKTEFANKGKELSANLEITAPEDKLNTTLKQAILDLDAAKQLDETIFKRTGQHTDLTVQEDFVKRLQETLSVVQKGKEFVKEGGEFQVPEKFLPAAQRKLNEEEERRQQIAEQQARLSGVPAAPIVDEFGTPLGPEAFQPKAFSINKETFELFKQTSQDIASTEKILDRLNEKASLGTISAQEFSYARQIIADISNFRGEGQTTKVTEILEQQRKLVKAPETETITGSPGLLSNSTTALTRGAEVVKNATLEFFELSSKLEEIRAQYASKLGQTPDFRVALSKGPQESFDAAKEILKTLLTPVTDKEQEGRFPLSPVDKLLSQVPAIENRFPDTLSKVRIQRLKVGDVEGETSRQNLTEVERKAGDVFNPFKEQETAFSRISGVLSVSQKTFKEIGDFIESTEFQDKLKTESTTYVEQLKKFGQALSDLDESTQGKIFKEFNPETVESVKKLIELSKSSAESLTEEQVNIINSAARSLQFKAGPQAAEGAKSLGIGLIGTNPAIDQLTKVSSQDSVERLIQGFRESTKLVIDGQKKGPFLGEDEAKFEGLLKQLARNPNAIGPAAQIEDIRQLKKEQEIQQFLSDQKGIDPHEHDARDRAARLLGESATEKQLALSGSGFVQSFKDGFTGIAAYWKATAENMAQIGQTLASSLSTNLTGAMSDFIFTTKTAGEAFREFATNVLKQLTNILLEKAITGIIGYATSGLSGLVGGATTALSDSAANQQFGLTGASAIRTIPSQAGPYAEGGLITLGSGTKDDVPALLMKGEYVIPKRVVDSLGVDYFEEMRLGKTVRKFASGGLVEDDNGKKRLNVTLHLRYSL